MPSAERIACAAFGVCADVGVLGWVWPRGRLECGECTDPRGEYMLETGAAR